jgi:hypothetical protein
MAPETTPFSQSDRCHAPTKGGKSWSALLPLSIPQQVDGIEEPMQLRLRGTSCVDGTILFFQPMLNFLLGECKGRALSTVKTVVWDLGGKLDGSGRDR